MAAWGWVVLAVMLGLANGHSASRTGVVQLTVLVIMACIWGGWRRPVVIRVLLAAVAGYIAASLVAQFHLGRSTGIGRLVTEEVTCSSRWGLWRNVLELIGQRPLGGWGWGELDFAHYDTLYAGERFCEILDNAHNLPLHLAVELGLPVALLACGAVLWGLWIGRPWAERDLSRQFAWCCLAVLGLHSLLEYPLWYSPFLAIAASATGILWSGHARAVPVIRKALHLGLPFVLMLAAAGAAYDYRRVSQLYMPWQERLTAYQDDTLRKVSDSWLFADQVRFAELVTRSVEPENAARIQTMARQALHFSPEPRVIERLLESSRLLGDREEAAYQEARFSRAFPEAFEHWRSRQLPSR